MGQTARLYTKQIAVMIFFCYFADAYHPDYVWILYIQDVPVPVAVLSKA